MTHNPVLMAADGQTALTLLCKLYTQGNPDDLSAFTEGLSQSTMFAALVTAVIILSDADSASLMADSIQKYSMTELEDACNVAAFERLLASGDGITKDQSRDIPEFGRDNLER